MPVRLIQNDTHERMVKARAVYTQRYAFTPRKNSLTFHKYMNKHENYF
jgi:hypothetical protein